METSSDIQTITDRLSVTDIYGDVKKAGSTYVMKCCFHEEKTASFHIYPNLTFHCFGCGKGGSPFDFIMEKEHISFPEAKKFLAEKAGVQITNTPNQHSRLYDINRAALGFYTSCLEKHDKAKEYLTTTRSVSPESITRFKLGCTSEGSLTSHLRGLGFTADEIMESGLAVKREGIIKDFFFKRVMFPIIQNGKVLGFSGRVFGQGEPKYLNTASTPIFHKKEILFGLDPAAIKDAGYVVIVEGQLDVIIAHQYGVRNTVAPLGTAFTEEHLTLLKRYTNWVIVIYDGDKAGDVAAQRTVKMLFFDGKMRGGVGLLPAGEDPDSFLRKGNDLYSVIESCTPFAVFLVDRFKGTKRMVFNQLLQRESPLETAEFIAFRGTKEDADMFSELQARLLIEKDIQKDPVILRQKTIEIRKHKNHLILLSKGRFLLSTKIASDQFKQAAILIKNILKVVRKSLDQSRNKSS